MWWTSLYINKQHNTICGGPHSNKLCGGPHYKNKQHNTICGGPHYT